MLLQDLDAIKEKNSQRKQAGGGEMETVRNKLKDIKSSIVGTIEEKKLIHAQIEAIRNVKRAAEDQIKNARAVVSGTPFSHCPSHCFRHDSFPRRPPRNDEPPLLPGLIVVGPVLGWLLQVERADRRRHCGG